MEELKQHLEQLDGAHTNYLDTMDKLLGEFKTQMQESYIIAREPQLCAIGTQNNSVFNVETNQVTGETLYWAKPRIDKHSYKLYNEIYSWCKDTFNASQWVGDLEHQMYYFNRVEDRDWFVMRWS